MANNATTNVTIETKILNGVPHASSLCCVLKMAFGCHGLRGMLTLTSINGILLGSYSHILFDDTNVIRVQRSSPIGRSPETRV